MNANIHLTPKEKIIRHKTSPIRPLADEVWLYIIKDTETGARLSSDYCEARVNECAFRRLGPDHAAMLKADAVQCGLDDGWT